MEQEQRQKQQQASVGQRSRTAESGLDAWAGLDALGAGSTPIRAPAVRVDDADDWGLGDFGAAAPASTSISAPASAARRPAQPAETKKQASTLGASSAIIGGLDAQGDADDADDWGLADFGAAARGSSSAPVPAPMSAPQDEDDILGMLSRPVEDVRAARVRLSYCFFVYSFFLRSRFLSSRSRGGHVFCAGYV